MFQIPSIIILLQHLSIDFETKITLKLLIQNKVLFHMSYSGINDIFKHKCLLKRKGNIH